MTAEETYMALALAEAQKAKKYGEVPIGAIIVQNGKVIGRGHNVRRKSHSALDHAELRAISGACKRVHDWRLENATMYVTLSPCIMCAGAIINARINKVVVGADNPNQSKTLLQEIFSAEGLNHKTEMTEGVLKEECSLLLTNFFKDKRKKG